jgi:hypothetical protein
MSKKLPLPLHQLIAQMQADAQLWGDLLRVSGEALEIPKCNYYVMRWKFKPSGIPELDADVNTLLHLKNGDCTSSVMFTNDAITVAHKTLGTWKLAAPGQKKQAEELMHKSNEYGRTIMASPVTRIVNWTAYHTIYLPRMTFVLPTSYLSTKILQKIEQRAIGATLCEGGFLSTFSWKVAFGPHRYGGIEWEITIEQLIVQVQEVIKHLRCPGENHNMLWLTFAWAQLGSGMGLGLLESPGKNVLHLECAWIQSIGTGLHSIKARIETYQPIVHKKRQLFNTHIMDAICIGKQLTNPEIRRINACRLFLKVILLSDNTSPNGREISKAYCQGDSHHLPNWPTIMYHWQDKPDKTSWALWRRSLCTTYLRNDNLHYKFHLATGIRLNSITINGSGTMPKTGCITKRQMRHPSNVIHSKIQSAGNSNFQPPERPPRQYRRTASQSKYDNQQHRLLSRLANIFPFQDTRLFVDPKQ